MSLASKIVAGFLLIFLLPPKALTVKVVLEGILNHDINLDIPNFQMSPKIDDIRWDRNKSRIIRVHGDEIRNLKKKNQVFEKYQVLENGTLRIKQLQINDSSSYEVSVYNKDGLEEATATFDLRILERVSKPTISWSCTNRTLTCEITNGTDPTLTLHQNNSFVVKKGQKVITHKWTNEQNVLFMCTARNKISQETSEVVKCSEKGLDIYLIIGICGGGVLFLLFVALLVLYTSKRRKECRSHGEELEVRAHKITFEERSQKPHQSPASAAQNPAVSQPPPPPSHRPKAHGHRPPPPGHRAQHHSHPQHQRRPPLAPGTQARQQKGPPLPKPRVQPKPPHGATENS